MESLNFSGESEVPTSLRCGKDRSNLNLDYYSSEVSVFVHSDELDNNICVFDLGGQNEDLLYQRSIPSNARLFEEKRQVEFGTSGTTSPKGKFEKSFEILLEILALIFTSVDMTFVGILVYRHWSSEEVNDPLEAWAMLLPIFLSVFGVQVFFERYPPQRCWYNEFLHIPLLGPIFCTGEMLYAKLCYSGNTEAIRIEEESIKLKQFESIFRAFPEGVVMLTVFLISRQENSSEYLQSWMMEIICVAFAIVSLAECHWYAIVSDFYRIHDKRRPSPFNHEDRKRPHKLRVWQKLTLFLHAFFAIGLRVFCEGLIRATVYFTMNSKHSQPEKEGDQRHSLTEVLLIVFFGETVVRALLHLGAQIVYEVSTDVYKYLMNPFFESAARNIPQFVRRSRREYKRINTQILDGTTDEGDEEFVGIHGAVKHGLLATFTPLQFQSKYLPTVLWFYIENLAFLLAWFVLTRKHEVDVGSPLAFVTYDRLLLALALFLFLVSVAFQAIVSHLTFPESEVFIVRLRRVLQANPS